MGFLQTLAYMGIFLLSSIPVLLVYFGTKNNILTIISGVIAGLIALIFSIKLMVDWSLSSAYLLYEKKSVGDSLRLSKRLVKKDWWSVFGKVIVMSFIVGGLISAVTVPLMFLTFFLSLIPVVGNAIQSGLGAAISAAVSPLGVIFITKLFLGMKENNLKN
jgi:hypothetical protein